MQNTFNKTSRFIAIYYNMLLRVWMNYHEILNIGARSDQIY